MNTSLRHLAIAALIFTTSISQAQNGGSATATKLDEDSIRVDIADASAYTLCPDTITVVPYRDGVSQTALNYPAGTDSVQIDNLLGGAYFFRVTYCLGPLDFPTEPEPVVVTVDTNVVTIAGALPVPESPTFVEVIASSSQEDYAVSWSASNGVDEYQISDREHPLEDWQLGFEPSWGGWSNFISNGQSVFKTFLDQPPNVYQYRVRACNDSGCSDSTLSPPVVVEPPQANAGQTYYMPDAKIRAIWTAPEGCYVLFETLPDACGTKFSNAHALIPFVNPNHEKMYSQVFLANAMGKRIDVWFDDNGDCDTLATLMTIGKIEVVQAGSTRRSWKAKGRGDNE